MADYPISIDAVRNMLLRLKHCHSPEYIDLGISMALHKLEGFTPMDVATVVHGRWDKPIENAPTIDAVPVVRCRECWKRGNERECPMCHEEFDGCDYCTIDYTSDDGFCHMGKKMDAKEVETDGQEGT